MSKSKGNVIGPGAYLQKFGADALRCYLMFMGPFSEGGDFSDGGINGIVRFLRRLWSQIQLAVGDASQTLDRGELAKLHRCIRQVTQDTEELRYNTALAALMELCSSIKSRVSPMTKDEARAIIVMLAPFAPHFAEEAWAHMGGEPSLFDKAQWPVFEQSLCEEDLVELVVQVNGKRRGSVKVPRGSSESKVMDHINEHDSVFKLSQIAPLKRVVFVENRIINFVV